MVGEKAITEKMEKDKLTALADNHIGNRPRRIVSSALRVMSPEED